MVPVKASLLNQYTVLPRFGFGSVSQLQDFIVINGAPPKKGSNLPCWPKKPKESDCLVCSKPAVSDDVCIWCEGRQMLSAPK